MRCEACRGPALAIGSASPRRQPASARTHARRPACTCTVARLPAQPHKRSTARASCSLVTFSNALAIEMAEGPSGASGPPWFASLSHNASFRWPGHGQLAGGGPQRNRLTAGLALARRRLLMEAMIAGAARAPEAAAGGAATLRPLLTPPAAPGEQAGSPPLVGTGQCDGLACQAFTAWKCTPLTTWPRGRWSAGAPPSLHMCTSSNGHPSNLAPLAPQAPPSP